MKVENMQKILMFSLPLLIFIACINGKTNESRQVNTEIKENNEKNRKYVISWGEISICMPEIDKMQNIYSLPKIKKMLDKWEYKNNTVLAYYVNVDVYNQINEIDKITYDDYFKIYSVNNFKNAFADKNALEKIVIGTKRIFNTNVKLTKNCRI